jgi:hypothetical protein
MPLALSTTLDGIEWENLLRIKSLVGPRTLIVTAFVIIILLTVFRRRNQQKVSKILSFTPVVHKRFTPTQNGRPRRHD